MIFGLAIVPVMLGAGVGLDMARAMIVRARLTEALDAAGLAQARCFPCTSRSTPPALRGQARRAVHHDDVDGVLRSLSLSAATP
jgi:Flp pilus assembly protein TadG